MNKTFILSAVVMLVTRAHAQVSLDSCISYAVSHSTAVEMLAHHIRTLIERANRG